MLKKYSWLAIGLAMLVPALCGAGGHAGTLFPTAALRAPPPVLTGISASGRYVTVDSTTAVGRKLALVELGPSASIARRRTLELPAGDQLFFALWAKRDEVLIVAHTSIGFRGLIYSAYTPSSGTFSKIIPSPDYKNVRESVNPMQPYGELASVWQAGDLGFYSINFDSGRLQRIAQPAEVGEGVQFSDHQHTMARRFRGGGAEAWLALQAGGPRTLLELSAQDVLMGSRLLSTYTHAGAQKALVLSSAGLDKLAVVELSMDGKQARILSRGPADVRKVWMDRQGRFVGAQYDGPPMAWSDVEAGRQAALAKLIRHRLGFPDIVGEDASGDVWLVRFQPEQGVDAYYLYGLRDDKLTWLADADPQLKDRELGKTTALEATGESGLRITGLLTPGSGCAKAGCPLVVTLHGGPRDRDYSGLNRLHQWLASRGYAALSVNYRGSRGFGKRFEDAGLRQWGAGIADDVERLVQEAQKVPTVSREGYATWGGSHGAYEGLVLATRPGNAVKCVVALSGTARLTTFTAFNLANTPGLAGDLFASVGDPASPVDRIQMLQRSPAENIANTNAMFMLAHGTKDSSAPVEDIRQFANDLAAAGKPFLYAEFKNAGHQFQRPGDSEAFHGFADQFLQSCLQGKAEPPSPSMKSQDIGVRTNIEELRPLANEARFQ